MTAKTIPSKFIWWPRLIIAAMVLFALFVANLVRLTMQSDVDLVSKDYYQKELAYQQHIDQVKATQALPNQVHINHAASAEMVSVVFPLGHKTADLKGELVFFRPSDIKQDFSLPLALNSDGQQHVPTTKLSKGLWRVKLTWTEAGQAYFLEKDFTVE